MAAEDSLSANNLPSPIRPYWDSICASLCDHYGARENPWILDPVDGQKVNRQRQSESGKGGEAGNKELDDDPDFVDILKFVVDTLCPEEQFDIKSDSKISRIVSLPGHPLPESKPQPHVSFTGPASGVQLAARLLQPCKICHIQGTGGALPGSEEGCP